MSDSKSPFELMMAQMSAQAQTMAKAMKPGAGKLFAHRSVQRV